ncbi:Trp biosynthesis-associated membrane protein [Microbacterium sp. 4R-513]|uniref:Trp biosynthesis-associated membrane protein n=1 Tax=Microbacterium sp. 4R-513 TaxID=2567934 RepID=UPI0013E15CC6|nr:Trp biosynthesis-associated membrane protein [Microbacterium sp. 4R-513]QIG40725.1 Trp biosynthesis-associated membrane protein [Microbacterium sp. 4R-513]
MIARARLLAVVATVLAGAVGIISSTQTWLTVVLNDGAKHSLAVAGADAIPVLAPLSLAALALGAALSIVGLVLRYVFGALALAIGAVSGILTAQVAFARPLSSVASTVTTATGLTGEKAVSDLVLRIEPTLWPAVTLFAWIVLVGAGVLTVVTARRWRGSGRKYTADATTPASAATGPAASRPHDAIDSWDDLSRGDDPTAR